MSSSSKFYQDKPHWLCFIFSFVLLFSGIFNYHSSLKVENYNEMTGQLCNLESKQVFHNKHYETRYNFDIEWYSEGRKQVKHFSKQIDRQEEGELQIWVSDDNQKVVLYAPEDIKSEVPFDIAGFLITGVLGILLYKQNRQKKK